MGIIKNYNQLATTGLRKQVLDILEVGLAKAAPQELMTPSVQYDEDFNSLLVHTRSHDMMQGRFFVVGGGKAAGGMAEALEHIMGPENITAGVVSAPPGDYQTERIKVVKAEHPLPGRKGRRAVDKMFELKEKCRINENDAVICLLSGGGSALLPAPAEGLRISDIRETTRMLMECGATIQEINTVRKHLSRVKGGQLASYFQPARVLSLVVSDVIQDDLSVIASAPTAPDPTTFKDAWWVLDRYRIADSVPDRVRKYLNRGARGKALETPKELENTYNYIVGNNAMVLEAMAHEAHNAGFKPIISTTTLTGEAEKAAYQKAAEIKRGVYGRHDAILFGGETTVALPDEYGQGGRNQHLAAASIKQLAAWEGEWVMVSLNTDGVDFSPTAAGAIIDSSTLRKAESIGLDVDSYLGTYNTHNLFKKLGDGLIETGETGTNVGDVILYFSKA